MPSRIPAEAGCGGWEDEERRAGRRDGMDFPTEPHENQPTHLSRPLRRFLREHEVALRKMAAEEAARGEFTVGLSRCLDILDSEWWPR